MQIWEICLQVGRKDQNLKDDVHVTAYTPSFQKLLKNYKVFCVKQLRIYYPGLIILKRGSLTIKVPLILKVREIIFSRAKHIMGHFEGFFEGAETSGQFRGKKRSKSATWSFFFYPPPRNPIPLITVTSYRSSAGSTSGLIMVIVSLRSSA